MDIRVKAVETKKGYSYTLTYKGEPWKTYTTKPTFNRSKRFPFATLVVREETGEPFYISMKSKENKSVSGFNCTERNVCVKVEFE